MEHQPSTKPWMKPSAQRSLYATNACTIGWTIKGVGKKELYALCKHLAEEFEFAAKLNSTARQASAERAWAAISNFYRRCRDGEKKKGYPQ
jgi:putative transposase